MIFLLSHYLTTPHHPPQSSRPSGLEAAGCRTAVLERREDCQSWLGLAVQIVNKSDDGSVSGAPVYFPIYQSPLGGG